MTPRRIVALVLTVVMVAGCAQLMADSVESLLKQGIELFTQRRYDEAIARLLEVVRRDAKSWTAYLYLARSYVAKSSWADAIASGRKALELAPERGDVIPTLAEAFLGAGRDALARRQFAEAVSHFGEYVKLRPTDFQGYLQLGRAYLGRTAYADALRAFGQGLTQASDADGRGQLVQGLADGGRQALTSGNPGAAIDLLQEYVRHDRSNVSAYLDLGKAYWERGNVASALGAFQRVLELNPNDPEALQFIRGRR
jgi:tetratricopeptide (TPR) repeat protein